MVQAENKLVGVKVHDVLREKQDQTCWREGAVGERGKGGRGARKQDKLRPVVKGLKHHSR